MCKTCDAKRVVLISSIAALGESLARTASILDSINANAEKAVVLGRLREVFDLDHTTVELDESGELQAKAPESAADGFGAFLDELINGLEKKPEPEAQATAPAPEAAAEFRPSFPEFLAQLLGNIKAKETGELKLTREFKLVKPAGASEEDVKRMVEYVAKQHGVDPSEIEVV